VEKRQYPNTGIPARQLGQIRDYLSKDNSRSLGDDWGHKIVSYKLYYPREVIECKAFRDDVLPATDKHGETLKHETYFESRTGRILHLDTTDPTHITLRIKNGKHTASMRERVETIMGLIRYIRRVFITHGHDPAWHEVQHFIEKECALKLPTMELAHEASKGRTIIEKLDGESQHCSYAVIVMTGDDLVGDDEVRARENVIHEIGFFQGRYGRDRVCLLHEDHVTIPSNLSGIVHASFPKGRVAAALAELQRELVAAFPDDDIGKSKS
jgi:predicted nucleotide-binding protein